MSNKKTTVEGFKKRMKKLRAWTRWLKMFKEYGMYKNLEEYISYKDEDDTYLHHVLGISIEEEDIAFWGKIADKIDEVKV